MRTSALIPSGVVATLLISGTADAELVGIQWVDQFNPNPAQVTVKLVAFFDNPNDRVDAVAGTTANAFSLDIFDGSLINDDFGGVVGTSVADRPFGLSGQYDSWFTIGGDIPGNLGPFASYSSDPFGIIGGEITQLLTDGLTSLGPSNNFAYFMAGGVLVSANAIDGNSMTFAQMTISANAAINMTGEIQYIDANTGLVENVAFNVFGGGIPAPCTLAVLVPFALSRTRRRRQ